MNKKKSPFMTIAGGFLVAAQLLAASPVRAQNAADDKDPYSTRETVGTVLVSGVVGGILGLSTLSFYKNPQNHIRNIMLGAGAGMLASIIYLAVDLASSPMPADTDKPTTMILPDVDASGRVALVGTFRF